MRKNNGEAVNDAEVYIGLLMTGGGLLYISDDKGDKVGTRYWNFYDAEVIRFGGGSANERVECHFGKFNTGDNLVP